MGQRKRIALSYTYNENWIGGTYYIENLVHALNKLADDEKPHLIVLTNKRSDRIEAQAKLKYPYLSFRLASGEHNALFQFANKVTYRILKRRFFPQKIKGLDAAFPYYESVQQSLAGNKIYWIPDFQEHFSRDFFSEAAIRQRIENQTIIQASGNILVLSSQDAYEQFNSLYPGHTVNVFVMPFAVTHPPFSQLPVRVLKEKYALPDRYFICPNQFWKHKNHRIVLEALSVLKRRGIDVTIAFTGNTSDYRNPGYFTGLKDYVHQNKLDDRALFLGFIDRSEQLQLMDHSVAVIQPSLFEGWSTVVEDAKSMNKFLIASDIKVHREQLENSNAVFFDPSSATVLADAVEKAFFDKFPPGLFSLHQYDKHIEAFGKRFLSICISSAQH